MRDMDEEWAGARCFSEKRMAELADGLGAKANRSPTEAELLEFRQVARQAIDASLGLADMMEAA